jgi:hypothetical protein
MPNTMSGWAINQLRSAVLNKAFGALGVEEFDAEESAMQYCPYSNNQQYNIKQKKRLNLSLKNENIKIELSCEMNNIA